MSSQDVINSTARKLKYYMEVKRLEDGFDLSPAGLPRQHYPPMKARPVMSYDGIYDRSLKHYFHDPQIRQQLTQWDTRPSLTDREQQVRLKVDKQMRKYHYSNPWRHPAESAGKRQSRKRSETYPKNRPYSAGSTVKKRQVPFGTAPIVLRSRPRGQMSRREVDRLVNSATRLLVATEGISPPNNGRRTNTYYHTRHGDNHSQYTDEDNESLPYIAHGSGGSTGSDAASNGTYEVEGGQADTGSGGGSGRYASPQRSGYLAQPTPPSRATHQLATPPSGRRRPKSAKSPGSGHSKRKTPPSNAKYAYDHHGRKVPIKEAWDNLSSDSGKHRSHQDAYTQAQDSWPMGHGDYQDDYSPNRVHYDGHGPAAYKPQESRSTGHNGYHPHRGDDYKQHRIPYDQQAATPAYNGMHIEVPKTGGTTTHLPDWLALQMAKAKIEEEQMAGGESGEVGSNYVSVDMCTQTDSNISTQTVSFDHDKSVQTFEDASTGGLGMKDNGSQAVVRLETSSMQTIDVPGVAIQVDIPPPEPEPEPEFDPETLKTTPKLRSGKRTVYEISVYTGNRIGASTQADVEIVIHGVNGNTGKIKLKQAKKGNKVKFQKGQVDVFNVDSFCVGKLKCVSIGHQRKEIGFGWFLDKVVIRELDEPTVYEFPCENWLSSKDGDHKTIRTLPVGNVLHEQKGDEESSTSSSSSSEESSESELEADDVDGPGATVAAVNMPDEDEGSVHLSHMSSEEGDQSDSEMDIPGSPRQAGPPPAEYHAALPPPLPQYLETTTEGETSESSMRHGPGPALVLQRVVVPPRYADHQSTQSHSDTESDSDSQSDSPTETETETGTSYSESAESTPRGHLSSAETPRRLQTPLPPIDEHGRGQSSDSDSDSESDSETESETETETETEVERPRSPTPRSSGLREQAQIEKDAELRADDYMSGFKDAMKAVHEADYKKKREELEEEMRQIQQGPSIFEASKKGDLERVKILVQHNNETVNQVDEMGWTALHVASAGGHLDLIKWLCLNGAQPDLLTPTGYSPMHCAAIQGHVTCMGVLHVMGVSINSKTVDQQTPLHLAAMNGQIECCKWLIANRAQVNHRDHSGRSAADLAEEYQHPEILGLLQSVRKELKRQDSIIAQLRRSSKSSLSRTGTSSSHSSGSDSGSSASSSSSEEDWEDDQQTSPPQVNSEPLNVAEKKEKQEKEIILSRQKSFQDQQKKMEEQGTSFLDTIRQEME